MRVTSTRSTRPQRGATLIEVLVSIVIASIGLLALAGINAASVRYSKLSQYRSVAALMAQDISERIRANNTDANVTTLYAVETAFSAQASLGSAPVKTCLDTADTCTSNEMATADLFYWRQAVRNNLPDGSVFLQSDAVVPKAMNLWIVWRDANLGAEDEFTSLTSKDCPTDLGVSSDKSVRCIFFRIQV